MKNNGRGRLSSLDLLPDEAQDDLIWAIGRLNERKRSQADILFELNDRLAVKGIEPISRSAFNRASMRLAARARRIAERQQIYAGVAEQLTPEAVGKTDRILAEFLKTLIDELLDGEDLSTKNAMELARAYHDVVKGQSLSITAQQRAEAAIAAKAAKAVDQVAKAKGLTADTVAKIKRELGILKDQAEAS